MSGKKWLLQKKWRLLAISLIIALLPIFCLDLFVYLGAFNTLRQKIDKENFTVAQMAAVSIENTITSLVCYGQGRASGPGLIEAVKKKDEAFAGKVLKSITENSAYISRAYLATPKGICWVDYPVDPEAKGRDSSGRDWYKGVSKEWEPYVSELYLRATKPREYLIAVAVPVKEDGQALGILVLQVNMQSVFKTLNFKVGEGYLYLVDHQGTLIYHPQKQIDRIIDYSSVPVVRKVMQGLEGTERAYNPLEKEERLSAYVPVKHLGWGIIAQQTVRAAFAPVKQMTTILALISGILVLIIAIFITRWVSLFWENKRQEALQEHYRQLLAVLHQPWAKAEDLGRVLFSLHLEIWGESAVFYVLNEEGAYVPCASAGLSKEPPAFRAGEGQPGKAVLKKDFYILKEIPPDSHLNIKTEFGEIRPREILYFPLLHEGEVLGLIEVGSPKPINREELKEHESGCQYIGMGLSILFARERIIRLSEELQKKNEEMAMQNNELLMQSEELQAQTEELQIQQEELARVNLQLARVSKAKSDFLANMSHELRTPLNSIIGFSEVLEERLIGPLNEKQEQYVKTILENGHHLLSLINDILDLAKVEAGKMDLELAEVEIKELLERSILIFKEKAIKQQLELSTEIEEDVGVTVADSRKLKQIVFNLLSNAVKFTPAGGSVKLSARRVKSEAVPFEESVEISVADTGIGIAPQDMDRLFKEFQQLESPYGKKHEGTGLGLALTKRLVELHGGSIRVESEPGKGSKFIFVIPAKRSKPVVMI